MTDSDQQSNCSKCDQIFTQGENAIMCEGCAQWYHIKCASLSKAAYDAIGKNNSIHWFCPVCDKKIMGMISVLPQFAEKRERETIEMSRTKEELESLTKELKALDIKKKIELFEGVTKCLGPKIQFVQESMQKVEKEIEKLADRQVSWSQVASANIRQNPIPQSSQNQVQVVSRWNPSASVVVNNIADPKQTKNSSTIKTELSKTFSQKKFKSVMKRANGDIIVELETETEAKELVSTWDTSLFGGSKCRSTKKRQADSVVLKDVPLPEDISETGMNEEGLHEAIRSKYPNAHIERFKKDGRPMHVIKITPENQVQTEELLTAGFAIGNLWVRAEKAINKPRVIQCYNCLQLGHIAKICKQTTKCSKCAKEGHGYLDCNLTNHDDFKCANCNGKHIAISSNCPTIQKKAQELALREKPTHIANE